MIDSERIVIADLTEDEQKWLDKLWSQYVARRDRNLLRASIYDGKRAVDTVGTIIAPQYRRLGIVLGWNAKAIDMLARRCNPERFYWADGDLESLGYTEFAESNNLIAELKAGLVSSLIHGPAFLINTMGDVPSGEPKSLLHVKDALSATGAWNPRRRQLDALLSFLSWDEERPTGFVMYLDNLTVTATRDGGAWSVQRQTHTFGVPAEALVYRPRTGRSFGSSRMTRPMIGLQNLGTRAVLRMEGHMDVYSVPQMVLMGASEDIFKNPDGSMKPSWQIALGRMLAVPDDDSADNPRADIKQFEASSPAPHASQLSTLAKLFAREASLPDSALAIADMANPTSADAYVAANDDLIAEAEGATDDWSLPARRAVARGLEMQNGSPVPALKTLDVKWRPPVHVSRAAAADAGAKQLAAGPEWLKETRVGLELLGLTESQIDESLAEKARMQGRATLRSLVDRAGVSAGGDVA